MWHDTQRYNLLVAPGLALQPGEHVEIDGIKRCFRNFAAVTSMEDELVSIKARAATGA
jgi:hypothetical protein